MKRIISLAAGLAIALAAIAQPAKPEDGKGRPKMQQLTVEQEAQMRVDQMASEMPLTQKQVNKLLKFYKKDITYRRENFRMSGGPRPEGGRRPDNDGAPKPGMGQGRPPKDASGMGPGGGRGPGMGNPPSERPKFQDVDMEQLEKYNLKQDKKLRRIIGDENFQAWRAAHPQEMPKLPDIELK